MCKYHKPLPIDSYTHRLINIFGHGSKPMVPYLGGYSHPFTSYFDVHQGYRVLTHNHILAFFVLMNVPQEWLHRGGRVSKLRGHPLELRHVRLPNVLGRRRSRSEDFGPFVWVQNGGFVMIYGNSCLNLVINQALEI